MYSRSACWILFCIVTYTQGVWCNNDPIYGSRIVGGGKSDIVQYAYNALCQIQTNEGTVKTCGGAIISNTSILTAAYCLDDAKEVKVRIGSTFRHSGGFEYHSLNFTQHPQYKRGGIDFDVGIIKIPEVMTINGNSTAIIKVENRQKDTEIGNYVTITGWGETEENGDQSEVLQMAKIQVQNSTTCEAPNTFFMPVFCAGGHGENSCPGDIGGPAVGSSHTLVGVTSNRVRCNKHGEPGAFVRVASIPIRFFIGTTTGV